ncbi:MAG: hypothetical protein P1V81_09100 [Planctomycetota bacterium]|nr:hypothetical protein [Planctomycetota bacterium]
MKKTTWLLVALAAAVLLGAWRIWDLERSADPSALLDQARVLAEGTSGEQGLALRKLDRALELAEEGELRRTILSERADLRRSRGAIELARKDLEELLAETPDDIGLRLRLAGLHSGTGDLRGARGIYEQILAKDEGHGWTRSLLARDIIREVEQLVDQLRVDLAQRIDSGTLAKVLPLVDQVTCLPPGDPVRSGLEAQLDELLNEDAGLVATLAIAEASARIESARADFAASLKSSVNSSNLFAFIDLLHRSGRLEETVDFGLAIADLDAALGHSGTLQALALALEEQGRARSAAAVVGAAVAKEPTWHIDFLAGWCAILYRAEIWDRLENAAIQLSRSAGPLAEGREQRDAASFYLGMSLFHRGRLDQAKLNLQSYGRSRSGEPVENAKGIAWLTVAAILEQTEGEASAHSAYYSCTVHAPEYSAKAWLQVANRKLADGAAGMEEAHALAMAIAADPTQTEAILPRLLDANRRGLAERGIDIGLLREQLVKQGRWYPDGSPTLILLLALAQEHLESNDANGAVITARRLLRDQPGFVPALDILSLALLVQGRPLERLAVLLERIETAGATESSLATLKDALRNVEGEVPPPALLRRWMRADPDFTGALELSRQLAAEGRTTLALASMAEIDRSLFNDRDRILYAELLDEIDQHEGVLQALAGASPEGPHTGKVALLRLIAGVALGRVEVIEAAMLTLESRKQPLELDLVQRALDSLADAQLGPGLLRLTRLLAASPKVYGGRSLDQVAVAEVLFGDASLASTWLDRAEAFLDDGSPTVGRLVLALTSGDDAGVGQAARGRRAPARPWSRPHHDALLAGLEGRRGEAEALAAEAVAADPMSSRSQLVAAALASLSNRTPVAPGPAPESAADLGPDAAAPLSTLASLPPVAGRETLVLLLCLDAPDWDRWSLARIGAQAQRTLLGPFAVQLLVDHALESGNLNQATTLLELGRKRWKSFTPFWNQSEDLLLALHGREDHPAVVGLRRQRRAAGAPLRSEPTPAELVLDLSFEAASRGQAQAALDRARQALELAPTSRSTLENLARCAEQQAPADAIAAWRVLLLLDDEAGAPLLTSDEASGLIVQLTEALERAGSQALSHEQLLELAARFPDSPLLTVETARRLAEALAAERGGLQRVFDLLDDFQDSHRTVCLEALEPGSVAAWFELLSTYDPTRALAFAEAQLDLGPTYLSTWMTQAHALFRAGQRAESLEAWLTLSRMTRDPDVALETAAVLAELGQSHELVTEMLIRARVRPGREPMTGRLEFLRARSLANIGAEYLTRAIEVFEALAAAPATPGLGRDELLDRLGITYLHRGAEGDGARARPYLSEAAERQGDSLRRDLFHALTNLCAELDKHRLAANAEAQEAAAE